MDNIIKPDLTGPAYKDAIDNSLYAINFRGLYQKNKYDIMITAPVKIKGFDDNKEDLSYVNNVSVFNSMYFIINAELQENFEIADFLNYQFYQCKDKSYFLKFTKTMFIDYCSKYKYENYPLGTNLNKYKFVMSWFENMERQFSKSNFHQNSKPDFEKIKLTENANINEITTYFEKLKDNGKINTSIENLKRVLISVFENNNGQPLKKTTLDSYFNKSKALYNRSKK
ncbi:hypothetical protein [Mucilaginibacter sp. BT774]|uniref:hypothetical protein n=1 Tax=Mucilaginibacter sp. BT774 TaxID=3062276 RepID=UPI00267747B7|nr:hypothetical protein [Mucilaginibacter sp. BT774]MDO3627281.1 hypothetical protein [Mucilaginibacter sp. BT774]